MYGVTACTNFNFYGNWLFEQQPVSQGIVLMSIHYTNYSKMQYGWPDPNFSSF